MDVPGLVAVLARVHHELSMDLMKFGWDVLYTVFAVLLAQPRECW